MRRSNRRWLWSTAALALVAGSGYWYVFDALRNRDAESASAGEPLIVRVENGDIEAIVATTGTLDLPGSSPDASDEPLSQSRLRVRSDILQTEAAAVAAATQIYVQTVRGRDRQWNGELADVRLTPAAQDSAIGYNVEFEIDNSDGALEPGQSAQVFFVARLAENVLIVPLGALSFSSSANDASEAVVRVLQPDDTIELRPIVVGSRNRVDAEVISGLQQGDRIIAGTILSVVEHESDERRRVPDFRDRLFEPAPDRR